MVDIKVRHLHKVDGRWYWIPSKTARALGFKSYPLGPDLHKAKVKAEEINAQLDAERTREIPERVVQGSVSSLIKKYLASPNFADLAEKTRREYNNILKRIEDKSGQIEVSGIKRAEVVKTYEKLREKHGESMAAAMMRVWRILLGYAYDIGWREDNPAKGLKLKTIRPRQALWT